MSIIKTLELPFIESGELFTSEDSVVGPFSQINLIIGANNSGKSRLARAVFMFDKDKYRYNIPEVSYSELSNLVDDIFSSIVLKMKSNDYFSSDDYEPVTLQLSSTRLSTGIVERIKKNISIHKDSLDEMLLVVRAINLLKELFDNGKNIDIEYYYLGSKRDRGVKVTHILEVETIEKMSLLNAKFEQALSFFKSKITTSYIPTIRGLRPLYQDHTNFYLERTMKDYFKKIPEGKTISTGLELYENLDEMLRGTHKQRKKVEAYEKFLSENFFGDQDVSLIPRKNVSHVYVKIGEHDERPIFDFGDGLQSLIVCTFFPFMEEKGAIFVIEEPDSFMHASMQRKLIEVFTGTSLSHHQYFITTHSNHMLDVAGDYSQITILRLKRGISEEGGSLFSVSKVDFEDRNTLNELGVRNSSALIANSVIWVEGITDRLYYKELFRMFLEAKGESHKFREDSHYAFMEYQGANLPHYAFDIDKIDLKFLSPNSLFILDGDVDESKSKWRTKLRENKINAYFLECKEAECLLSDIALKRIFEIHNVLPKFRESVSYGLIMNKKRGNKFESLSAYASRKAGSLGEDASDFKYFSKESKIINKAEFAREVVKHGLLELNDETLKICNKIYDLVIKCN